ncbi:MAG: hypothetical protein QOH16_3844 [Gaiellaceae bacterium]|jgi:hypothetical protein|nr:hypothetical protein [Gaiellaceae bacterium]
MKRAFILAAALCVLALGAVSPASALATYTTSCPAYSQQVASVSYLVTGEPVTGANSNVWANADYTRTLQIYRVTKNTYCATWRDSGTFVTVAGQSPAGTGTLDAGIVGRLTRTAVTTTFTATWQPAAPRSGALGTFAAPADWTSVYFNNTDGFGLVWYSNLYTTSANGAWGSRTGYPSFCDIVSA